MSKRRVACTTWCSPSERQRTTDFSSRQVEWDSTHPGLSWLSRRSLSTKPSIDSRIGFKCLARPRYSSFFPWLGSTSKITENIMFPFLAGSGGDGRDIVAPQEADTFAPKRRAHGFEMHQVGAAADLDVALCRRLRERIEQPTGVVIQHQPVPFAADDRDRRADLRRIVGELA